MDEERNRDNNISNSRPQPIYLPSDDQPSSDHGSEDTFLSLSPDIGWDSKRIETSGMSPNVEKFGSSNKYGSPNVDKMGSDKQHDSNGHVDTAAPFESVKQAVSKFGVIVDWKAHRAQTIQRRHYIEQELDKAQEDIPLFKEKAELAEKEKDQALRDLDSTKRLVQELKLNLERAQTEERQAKQDSELAHLRLQEMEQGITNESSVAAKTQLEVAKARYQAAASEVVTATNELEETRKDYQILVSERDAAIQKAQEAVSAAKEIEREVEDLTIQLITTKESIESTHASHLEAEEHRLQELKERDQDAINLEYDVKQTEDELEKVKKQIILAKDSRAKLETSSALVKNLKDELAVYMQGKMPEVDEDDQFTRKDIQSGVAGAKTELDEVNREIQRTSEEITRLKTETRSLTAKLESEKQALTNVRKQKGLGAGAVVNLESELKRSRLELDDIRKREKEAREKLDELPKRLREVTEETEKVRSLPEGARLELEKAKEAAEEAKTGVNSASSKLTDIQKQIEAARAQEKIALGAINALQTSESSGAQKKEGSKVLSLSAINAINVLHRSESGPKGAVTISLQEYYETSKRAYEAEVAANKRVEEAAAKIDEAKESEMQSLKKLTQLNLENAKIKDALNAAQQRAEMAKESTVSIEEELKKRKGENGQTQKPEARGGLFKRLSLKANNDAPSPSPTPANSSPYPKGGGSNNGNSNTGGESSSNTGESSSEAKGFFRRRKKSIMPKFTFINNMKKPFGRNSNS